MSAPIRAVPLEYRGILFRSTLEADWAATLVELGIDTWSYEPDLVDIGGARYLCDFYLPAQSVWLEVKGPHDERIDKPTRLAKALRPDRDDWRAPIVVIGRVPIQGCASWHGTEEAQDIVLWNCRRCDHVSFVDLAGTWQCRVCGAWAKPYDLTAVEHYRSQTIPFARAPRPWDGR